jgi:hypothetical protein
VTPSIYFIILVIVLGTLALGWSFYRQQFKPAPEPGGTSCSVSLPGKHVTALRVRLGSALVALSLLGLTLLLGPIPSAWAAVSHPRDVIGPSLTSNEFIQAGQYLESDNGQYAAKLEDNGLFHLYHVDSTGNLTTVYWSSNAAWYNNNPYFAIMQDDGNFVVYHGSGPSNNLGVVWATNTVNPGTGTSGTGTSGTGGSCCSSGGGLVQ